MYIMIFHPDNDNYVRYQLKRLDKEVEGMVAARLKAVRAGGAKIVKFDDAPAATGSSGVYGFVD